MNLHEYQAKMLLSRFGVPVLRGYTAHTPKEAQKAAVNLGGGVSVVKAQVHAGGRGKAGGVKIVQSSSQAREAASKILGMKLVTPQTGEQGKIVHKVLVEQGAAIAAEYYLSLLVDREQGCIAVVCSREGGTEIEEVAAARPQAILRTAIKPEGGLQGFHSRRIACFLGLDKEGSRALSILLERLYHAFWQLDCSLMEINPLVRTEDGQFICLDAKMSIDSNALFRQREAFELMDYDEIDDREIVAGEVGINYIALSGNIGCMVNGAGLAMATMDMIKQAGGMPANFLDVGGGATKEMVSEAFRLILSDSAVKGVLINIFGGIMRCDVIAEGIIEAAKDLSIEVPLVVRLRGTNVDLGKKLLAESGLKIIPADDMDEAAERIVKAV